MTGSDVCPAGVQLPFVQAGEGGSKLFYLYAFPWESVTDTEDRCGRLGLSLSLDLTNEWTLCCPSKELSVAIFSPPKPAPQAQLNANAFHHGKLRFLCDCLLYFLGSHPALPFPIKQKGKNFKWVSLLFALCACPHGSDTVHGQVLSTKTAVIPPQPYQFLIGFVHLLIHSFQSTSTFKLNLYQLGVLVYLFIQILYMSALSACVHACPKRALFYIPTIHETSDCPTCLPDFDIVGIFNCSRSGRYVVAISLQF